MGRRPNQLIADFFERGAKLQDASNRYAHTCRKCGQLFPKGRIDSLFAHLIRRCPSLSAEDKQAIFSHTQSPVSASSKASRARKSTSQALPPPTLPSPDQTVPDSAISYPFACDLSALDTLAEVSGRHLDLATNHLGHNVPQIEDGIDSGTVEQALMLQLRDVASHVTPASPRHQAQLLEPNIELSGAEIQPPAIDTQPLRAEVSRLSKVDPVLHSGDEVESPQPDAHRTLTSVGPMTWNPVSRRGRPIPSAITTDSGPSEAGFGLLQQQHKARPRGRFTDSRRQEVQEVRKRGACIRCRMLKKPCSDGTPCKTCATVATARIWKGHCLRTKLADEIGILSARYWHAKAQIEMSAMHTLGPHVDAQTGRLAVLLFKDAASFELSIKRYCAGPNVVEPHRPSSVWIVDENEAATANLEDCLTRLINDPAAFEKSDFAVATVQHAKAVIEEEQANNVSSHKPSTPSGRSCYNLQSQLLRNTLELFVGATILSQPATITLQLQNESLPKFQNQPSPPPYIAEKGRGGQADATSSRETESVQSQVLALIESRCARLAKTIVNELERRLLQRQQVSRFATLLSAVIVLTSIGRMMSFYCTVAPRVGRPDDSETQPLDVLPSVLVAQGEQLAELLMMLLRMRGLPPSTISVEDGLLTVNTSVWPPLTHGQVETTDEQSEYTRRVAAWLQSARLRVGDLQARRDAETPAMLVDGGEWDLRLVSRLLLPWKAAA